MSSKCLDLEMNGYCTKGQDCPFCSQNPTDDLSQNLKLNVNAKVYLPKSKQNATNGNNVIITTNTTTADAPLNFNLGAKDYVPKEPVPVESCEIEEEQKQQEIEEENNDQAEGEEFEMIMKDIIHNDAMEELGEDESDEEKWFPKYKDCDCCKGFVYKCEGASCQNLGQCFCKMKDECEDEEEVEEV